MTQNAIALTLGALVLALISGFVVLSALQRDTVSYLVFVSGPAVTAIVGALLAKRTALIASDVATVKHQTDGLLSAAFTAASDERQGIAETAHADAVTLAAATPPPPDDGAPTLKT